MKEKRKSARALTEGAVMIALATVLSILKLVEMPYGGSVTPASMLPILIVSYRHGISTGLMTGCVYSLMQQLLGLNTLSYFTTWQSILAVILLDYIIAFTVIGVGGVFKGKFKKANNDTGSIQSVELGVGMLFVCLLRYICHTVGGATVWAGLSIPTEAALIYSLGYNATYMIPETIINVVCAFWIGGTLDFSKTIPLRISRVKDEGIGRVLILSKIASFIMLLAVVVDVILIAPSLQNPDDGTFSWAYIGDGKLAVLLTVTIIAVIFKLSAYILLSIKRKKVK